MPSMRLFPYAVDRSQRFDAPALKREIVELAMRLGASAVRVTSARESPETLEAMREAFSRGDMQTWGYAESYARKAAAPATLLHDARSVICVAMPYRTRRPAIAPLQGRVSNYAWSPDYHRRMQAMLRQIAAFIDEHAGAPVTAVACDTKPLAERAFAARSGLGWVGKHTNLISPGAGSFVFLGEIVTSLDLEHDAALKKTCGACTRCIPACPTGALRGDYTIDATRCISDLTQRTDAIPHELRPLIGTWVWGCDICQDACPPNARAHVRGAQTSGPHAHAAAAPDLVKLLHLRSGEFKRTYQPTAMGWRGAAVLRRNAAVALGNALDRSTVPALTASLQHDPHPLVRGHAAWALGRVGSPAALEALRARRDSEEDASVRAEILSALEPFATGAPLQER